MAYARRAPAASRGLLVTLSKTPATLRVPGPVVDATMAVVHLDRGLRRARESNPTGVPRRVQLRDVEPASDPIVDRPPLRPRVNRDPLLCVHDLMSAEPAPTTEPVHEGARRPPTLGHSCPFLPTSVGDKGLAISP